MVGVTKGGRHAGVFHTHAVAGVLGGLCVGVFAEPRLCTYMGLAVTNSNGLLYGGEGAMQLAKQVVGAAFVIGWNLVVTSLIMFVIQLFMPLRMSEEHLKVGDDAEHGEEAYALWGDGERFDVTRHGPATSGPDFEMEINHVGPRPGRNQVLHI